MKLIHVDTGKFAQIGDPVKTRDGDTAIIAHFVPPHKPAASGSVSVKYSNDRHDGYHYVSVWGLEWIAREDRRR